MGCPVGDTSTMILRICSSVWNCPLASMGTLLSPLGTRPPNRIVLRPCRAFSTFAWIHSILREPLPGARYLDAFLLVADALDLGRGGNRANRAFYALRVVLQLAISIMSALDCDESGDRIAEIGVHDRAADTGRQFGLLQLTAMSRRSFDQNWSEFFTDLFNSTLMITSPLRDVE